MYIGPKSSSKLILLIDSKKKDNMIYFFQQLRYVICKFSIIQKKENDCIVSKFKMMNKAEDQWFKYI